MPRPRAPASPLLSSTVAATAAIFASFFPLPCDSGCRKGCDLAIASYYVTDGQILSSISLLFGINYDEVLPYNNLTNPDVIRTGSRVNIPLFGCGCSNGGTLAQDFSYTVRSGDTYSKIATRRYHNLTTASTLEGANTYPATLIPISVSINVPVSCYCGDKGIDRAYGLFLTYPIRPGDTLETVAAAVGFSSLTLLRRYNPEVNFSSGEGIMFVPVKDPNGSYRPLKAGAGLSGVAIAGISIAAVVALILIVCLSIGIYKINKMKKDALLSSAAEDNSHAHRQGVVNSGKMLLPTPPFEASSTLAVIATDKLEFSYEELAKATNDFSMANKIGQGGFGAVYYAELRGEKAAIKKMHTQATREFLAELKVLAHVHHLNLVRLIGYCIQGSLFLVYEYIENGNLSQHLRGIAGKEPLPWSVRVQIALDSARGLEYIHEHTVPVYIHRDVKSANILIDKNFHAKVADFGLTKLTEVGSASLQSRLVGTFGYLPPEYARYGDISPKIDVYAFGVVLYELISAKGAVVETNDADIESRGLVSLFEGVLSQPDPRETLRELVDPRLGDDYPIDSAYKMAQLASACTQENPNLRPSMRSIVVALMTLSSSTEDWDVAALYENQALVNLMSGR